MAAPETLRLTVCAMTTPSSTPVPVLPVPGQLPLPFTAHRRPGLTSQDVGLTRATGPQTAGGAEPGREPAAADRHDGQDPDTFSPAPAATPLAEHAPAPVVAAVPVAGVLMMGPAVAAVLDGLGAMPDPLGRARAATVLLAELETARLAVVALRRTAVIATGLSSRDLAVELALSVGAASDLRAAARGRRRRPGR